MEINPHITDDYTSYADFWNLNVQKIEEIQKELDTSLRELENQYPLFEKHYNRVSNLAGVMSSIYASINALDGRDELLKLKSFIDMYKNRYTRNGIDFNTISYLMDKINTLRSRSFEDFPVLLHSEKIPGAVPRIVEKDYLSWPYHWFSFRRGWSWFMVSFHDIDMYTAGQFEYVTHNGSDYISAMIQGRNELFHDMFSLCRTRNDPPKMFITINNQFNYAVSQPGKKIFSRFDFISPRIEKYSGGKSYPLSPGRVRLFGIGHVYLDPDHPHESASSICAGA